MFLKALGLTDVPGIINNALRSLCGWLCELIYSLIDDFYKLFMQLGEVVYDERFTTIYEKISLVIGIFMVFRVTFWLIEMLVNPDLINDKEKSAGQIIKKVFICTVLLAVTPRIFYIANQLQIKIVRGGVITNLIATEAITESTAETKGREMSIRLFKNFYVVDEEAEQDQIDKIDKGIKDCEMYIGNETLDGSFEYIMMTEGKLKNVTNECLTRTKEGNDREYLVDFNGIFAVAVGAFVLWMIIMYCISVGARFVQLVFLQVVAPIPIMCYLTPKKDNMFSKWVKQCTTTYLDLFIRIAVIDFVIILSGEILKAGDDAIFGATDNFWIKIFLVLGLLTFARKVPDLIQELLPKSVTKASGDFGLSLKKRTESMVGGKFMYNTLKRAPGYAVGGVAGGLLGMGMGIAGGKGFGSRLVGGISGATRGFTTGSKKGNMFKNIGEVKKNQASYNNKLQQWRIAAGKGEDDPNTWSDYWERRSAGFKKSVGFLDTPAQKIDKQIKEYDKQLTSLNARSSVYGEVSGSVGKMEDRATSQLDTKTFGVDKVYQRDLQTRRRNFKALSQAMSNGDNTTALAMANSEYERANNKLMELVAAGKTAGDKEYDEANADRKKIVEIRGAIVDNKYNAAQAEGDMTDVLTETRNRFITYSLQDENGDAVIRNEAQHISQVVNHEDNREAFEGFENGPNGTSYAEFDKLSSEAKTANTQLSGEIYAAKTAKEALANSAEKQKADADDKFNS